MAQPTYHKLETLDDLKAAIAHHREEGRKLIRHILRLEDEYGDWEDRLIEIERAIEECEKQTGITKEEITAPEPPKDILEELFG